MADIVGDDIADGELDEGEVPGFFFLETLER